MSSHKSGAGQGKTAPSPTGPLWREVSSNGCIRVTDKETPAAGSGVQSRHGSGHVPRAWQWGDEELSLWVQRLRAAKEPASWAKGSRQQRQQRGNQRSERPGSSHSLHVCPMQDKALSLREGGLNFSGLAPHSRSGCKGTVTKRVVLCEQRI